MHGIDQLVLTLPAPFQIILGVMHRNRLKLIHPWYVRGQVNVGVNEELWWEELDSDINEECRSTTQTNPRNVRLRFIVQTRLTQLNMHQL